MKRIGLFGFWMLCVFAAAISLLVMFVEVLRGREKALDIAVAYDQTANVVINGDVDETISSRAYRQSLEGKFLWTCLKSVLDCLRPGHCQAAFDTETSRAKAWLVSNIKEKRGEGHE